MSQDFSLTFFIHRAQWFNFYAIWFTFTNLNTLKPSTITGSYVLDWTFKIAPEICKIKTPQCIDWLLYVQYGFKNNLHKNRACPGWNRHHRTVYGIYVCMAQKPDIYRSIYSTCDKLSLNDISWGSDYLGHCGNRRGWPPKGVLGIEHLRVRWVKVGLICPKKTTSTNSWRPHFQKVLTPYSKSSKRTNHIW